MENGLNYLNSLGLHKVKPGLERIRKLLKSLGNPENKVPGILVAGTNGKGSTASAIAAILSAQGYKVGLYTSPHLVNITERITINGNQISESELSSILSEIKESAEILLSESPSYFEVITAAAFLYFARQQVDVSVLEVGMGGRWDATNVITPIASVITNISKDHSEYLGDTIELIASEKACIIKPNVPVISCAKNEALKVIKAEANANKSPLVIYGADFSAQGQDTKNFSYKGIRWEINGLSSNLSGMYQLENLSLAIATLEAINESNNIKVNEGSIREGLQKINWPARFEVIREDPPLILDGAHNPGAANALTKSLCENYPNTKFTFLIAMLDDKDQNEFIKELANIAEKIIITQVPSDRSSDMVGLFDTAKKYVDNVEQFRDYKSAYEVILNLNKPSCVTGSIYLIGAIKNLNL